MKKFLFSYRYLRKLHQFVDVFKNTEYQNALVFDNSIEKFKRFYFPDVKAQTIEELVNKGKKDYSQAVQESNGSLPEEWKSGETLGVLLSLIINLTEPKVVLETGVANGVSTRIILKNLSCDATLYSFDVDYRTRKSVEADSRWNWRLIDQLNPISTFRHNLGEIDQGIDLWLHDSDHSRYWQRFEYKAALERLNEGGWLFSDDINDSSAWKTVIGDKANFQFVDGHKIFGVTRKES